MFWGGTCHPRQHKCTHLSTKSSFSILGPTRRPTGSFPCSLFPLGEGSFPGLPHLPTPTDTHLASPQWGSGRLSFKDLGVGCGGGLRAATPTPLPQRASQGAGRSSRQPPGPSVHRLPPYPMAPRVTGLGRGHYSPGTHLELCEPKSRVQRSHLGAPRLAEAAQRNPSPTRPLTLTSPK